MNCAVHTEATATGFCRNCGKALCAECTRDVRGILYCEPCLADLVARPPSVVEGGGPSPGLAAVLGFVPGLGAVYNGEYMKALIYVLIFAAFIGALHSDIGSGGAEPFFGILLSAFIVFTAVDAFRTAKARRQGQPSPWPIGGVSDKPIGPLILIGLGVLFLLNQFELFRLGYLFERFWPVLLIAAGVLLLLRRAKQAS